VAHHRLMPRSPVPLRIGRSKSNGMKLPEAERASYFRQNGGSFSESLLGQPAFAGWSRIMSNVHRQRRAFTSWHSPGSCANGA
jgi:hypothetical protein